MKGDDIMSYSIYDSFLTITDCKYYCNQIAKKLNLNTYDYFYDKYSEMQFPGDIVGQTRETLKNLSAILKAAGTDLEHVFKTLVFVADIDKFNEFNEEYKKFFSKDPPARSTMEIGKFNNGMVIEIEAIAVMP